MQRLGEIGVAYQSFSHAPVFTVEEAASVSGQIPGAHTKNLFLKDKKDGLWLVVVRAELRVDLNALAKVLEAPRFSFGSPELLAERLGITPGSVTPFALINDTAQAVRPILDQGLMDQNPINCHPLRNDRTISVSPDDLLRFIKACGHTPRIAPIPTRAP